VLDTPGAQTWTDANAAAMLSQSASACDCKKTGHPDSECSSDGRYLLKADPTNGCAINTSSLNINAYRVDCGASGCAATDNCTAACKSAPATPTAGKCKAGDTPCGTECVNAGYLTKCVGASPVCDCTLGKADGSNSCTSYPQQKQVCASDGNGYTVSQLSPVSGQNYCSYAPSAARSLAPM